MQQSTALALLKAGRNVFLTGSAGAGKTYVLQQYIDYLKKRKVVLAVTASTGIAATHLKGMTVHAWSGIGLRQKISEEELAAMKSKKYLREQIESVKVLIIDEISMLHKQQLELVDQVLQYFKKNQYAFGGIQVVFSGDFFQLPPVGFPGEAKRDKFAFMSPAWVDAKLHICYLTEQHRQEIGALQHILNDIRSGKVSPSNRALLEQAKHHRFEAGEIPPTLYSHNHDVNRTNNAHLRALEGETFTFEAKTKGSKRLSAMLKKAVQADELLYLKKTAKVIFVKNNPDQHYMNGTLGEVLSFEEEKGLPVVRLRDGSQLVVEPVDWTVEDETGHVLASYQQLPLRLAWAITVHKSQGMTLEQAKADLRRCFEKGQGYVALSRLQSLEGLQLVGFNELALQVDALALKADHRFQELSKELVQKTDAEVLQALEKRAVVFIRHCGGITDPEAIERYNKKLKEKKQKKEATHLITKRLIEAGNSLEAIAKERGLTVGTVMNHVAKLHGLFPKLDFSAYRPEESIVQAVNNAKTQLLQKDPSLLRPDGSISSKLLHDHLDGKVDYTTIKMALLFV